MKTPASGTKNEVPWPKPVKEFLAGVPAPSASDLAAVLGIEEGCPPCSEQGRSTAFDGLIGRLRMEPSVYQSRVMAQFCLHYLPELLELVMDSPQGPGANETMDCSNLYNFNNAYYFMFGLLAENRYFVKFLESSHPEAAQRAKKLPTCLATRVLVLFEGMQNEIKPGGRNAVTQEEANFAIRAHVERFCYVAIPLCQRPDCAVPKELKARLYPQLLEWIQRFVNDHKPFYDRFYPLLLHLNEGDSADSYALRVAQDELRGYGTCGRPGCDIEDNLYICERCKTIAYCGRAHQRDHWNDSHLPHKELCFKTSY